MGLVPNTDLLTQLGDNSTAKGVYRFADNTGKTYVGSTTNQDFVGQLSQHLDIGKLPADKVGSVQTLNMNGSSDQEVYNTEANGIVRNGGRSVDGGATSNVRAPPNTKGLFKDPDWVKSQQSGKSRFDGGCDF